MRVQGEAISDALRERELVMGDDLMHNGRIGIDGYAPGQKKHRISFALHHFEQNACEWHTKA